MHVIVHERLPEVIAAFEHQAIEPQGDDPQIAACSRALLDLLQEPAGQAMFSEVLSIRPNQTETGRYIADLTYRTLNMIALERGTEINFPSDDYDYDEPWKAFISETLDSTHEYVGKFLLAMWYRQVQSNVIQRAVNIPIAWQLYRERLGEHPRGLDIGASQNHTFTALMMDDNPLQPVEVVDKANRNRPDRLSTYWLNEIITQERLRLGPSDGIDRIEPWDADAKKWVKACTLRFKELGDRELVELYDRVDNYQAKDLGFMHLDFAKPLPSPLPGKRPDQKYDIIFYSFVLSQHQGEPEKVRALIENGLELASDNAILVVFDGAKPRPDTPTQLQFSKKRPPYSFRLLILDPQRPDLGFQEIVRWHSGRCTRAQLDIGRLSTDYFLRHIA